MPEWFVPKKNKNWPYTDARDKLPPPLPAETVWYKDKDMYTYKAEVERIVDGDTIDFRMDVGFHMTAIVRCRLLRVDAPEIRGEEKEAGADVARSVADWLDEQKQIIVQTYKTGKYGRWLAEVYNEDGECLNDKVMEWTSEAEGK